MRWSLINLLFASIRCSRWLLDIELKKSLVVIEVDIDLGPLPGSTINGIVKTSNIICSSLLSSCITPNKNSCGIIQLSDEVLSLKILSRLTPRDIASVGSVCIRFYEVTKNEDLWRMVCQNACGSETTRVLFVGFRC